MKKSDLKNLIKPIVKECIQEALLEEGLLSNVVSEVVSGLQTAPVIREQVESPPPRPAPKPRDYSQDRKKLLDAIGKEAYGGIDIFEGTTPAPVQKSPEYAAANPLADVDPGDSGVDISGIVSLGGKNWKALMG